MTNLNAALAATLDATPRPYIDTRPTITPAPQDIPGQIPSRYNVAIEGIRAAAQADAAIIALTRARYATPADALAALRQREQIRRQTDKMVAQRFGGYDILRALARHLRDTYGPAYLAAIN